MLAVFEEFRNADTVLCIDMILVLLSLHVLNKLQNIRIDNKLLSGIIYFWRYVTIKLSEQFKITTDHAFLSKGPLLNTTVFNIMINYFQKR